MSFVLKLSREQILINLNHNINKNSFIKFKNFYLEEKREPIAYIIKKRVLEKYFYVNNDVLIPRPETELIVEEVLKILRIPPREAC